MAGGRLELSREPLQIEALVTQVAASSASVPDHPPVEWEGRGAAVLADEERLRGALEAMVEAAAWWGREGPVRVRASVGGGQVVVEVSRRGAELAPEDAQALFRPRRPGEGAGSKLGLHVARGVAEAHGGSVTAEVTEGDPPGISLRLVLPAGNAV
jgi:two-component system sensor histidine kinase FlrB